MSALARELGAVNLGQGFPDDPGPRGVRARAAEAVLDGYNQYPPMAGLLRRLARARELSSAAFTTSAAAAAGAPAGG